jgi:hypothetical protein
LAVRFLRGDNFNNVDLSVIKNTTITEGKLFQFKVELINAFNHPLFPNPTGSALNPTNATFGQVVSSTQNNFPRRIQISLKFIFWRLIDSWQTRRARQNGALHVAGQSYRSRIGSYRQTPFLNPGLTPHPRHQAGDDYAGDDGHDLSLQCLQSSIVQAGSDHKGAKIAKDSPGLSRVGS